MAEGGRQSEQSGEERQFHDTFQLFQPKYASLVTGGAREEKSYFSGVVFEHRRVSSSATLRRAE
jgi:hypothetical protein